MNKILAGSLIGAVAVAGGLAGGSVYMGKKLEASYNNNFNLKDKRISIKTNGFEMGAMSGSASWTAEITPDLCNTGLKLTVRSEDTISRSLSGYAVKSKIYLVPGEGRSDILLFDADSTLGWSGSLSSEIGIPAGSFSPPKRGLSAEAEGQEGGKMEWDKATGRIKVSLSDGEPLVSKMDFKLPSFRATDTSGYGSSFEIKNLSYTGSGDMGLSGMIQQSGSAVFAVESVSLRSRSPVSTVDLLLSGLKMSGESKIGKEGLSVKAESSIDKIEANKNTFDNIRLNYTVSGISAEAVKKMQALAERQSQVCLSAGEQETMLKDVVLALAAEGVKAESKGNQIHLNGTAVTAEGEASLSAGNYASLDDLTDKIESAVKYKGSVSIDKGFISEVLKLVPNVEAQERAETEDKIVKSLVGELGAREEGGKIILSREKQ